MPTEVLTPTPFCRFAAREQAARNAELSSKAAEALQAAEHQAKLLAEAEQRTEVAVRSAQAALDGQLQAAFERMKEILNEKAALAADLDAAQAAADIARRQLAKIKGDAEAARKSQVGGDYMVKELGVQADAVATAGRVIHVAAISHTGRTLKWVSQLSLVDAH